MTEIAHGSIGIDINDGDALASLRRVDAAVQRTMSNIERQKATAEVDANIAPLEDKLTRAKRELKRLEGERASVPVGMETAAFDKAILNVKRQIKRLDGEKATVEIEYRANEAQANAAHKRQMAHLAEQSAAQKALSRQFNDDHRMALSMDKERTASIRQQTIGVREQQVQVLKLQKEYAKLTDKLEYLARKRPLGRENRAKVNLDTASTVAQMELLKAKLNALGRTPPINIKADLDRSAGARIGEALRGLVDKASNLSDLSVRLGPFTTSIKGAVTALGFLGPTLVDLTGSATALIGVLGTGLAGAASVAGAAALGAAFNFGGVYQAIKPLAKQFKEVNQLSDAYDKAVLKYGESSKQAKEAQKQLNLALKQVDPNVRKAVTGLSSMRKEWTHLTAEAAKRSFGDVISEGVHTASALLPTFARNTNQTLGILDKGLTGVFQRLRGPGAQSAFLNIGRNFNEGLAPALLGVEHLGAAFGHVAQSASRLLGPAGRGFERWAAGLDKGTSNANKLNDSIDRLGDHAKDVGKFFMALGRLIVTVLNGGADSGDRMTESMTTALTRWNAFLKTAEGKQSMAEFFDRAAKGADALYHALAPLATAFVSWSTNLSPFVTGVLRGIGYVSQLVAGITKLTGMAGPLGALGATFGAMFAIGRIGAFVSYLSRAADLLREMGAAKGLKTLFSGGLGKAMTAESFATGGAAAGAEIEAAFVSGGAAAAAEIRAAMVTGGSAGGIENAAGNLLGKSGGRAVATEAAEVTAGTAAGAKGAGVLRGALTALKGASLLTRASLVGLATFGGYELFKHFQAGKTAADKLRDSFYANGKAAKQNGDAYRASSGGIVDTADAFQRSTIQVNAAKKALDSTKKGTDDHRLALLDYRAALRDNVKARGDWITQSRTMEASTESETALDKTRLQQFDEGHKKQVTALQDLIKNSTNTNVVRESQEKLNALMSKRAPLAAAAIRAENQQAAAALNVGRAWRGQIPVLGAAAQQLGALSRIRPNLAAQISVKYNSPKDVGSVAREAQNALKAGGSITQVMKIVADSKDAEEALRRLRAVDLPAKTQRILERGGSDAISMLQRIIGRKLTRKEQRIASAGGPPVIALLERILGIKIPPKRIQINAIANQANAAINGVRNLLAGLPNSKNINITTTHNDVFKSKSVKDSAATGRAAGSATRALVGEGRTGKGASEIIADHATGVMRTVHKPTILDLKPSEAVIPTEPAYRSRGRNLFADFAKNMGIPGFAKGKKVTKPINKPSHKSKRNLSDFGKKEARKTATHNIKENHWKSTLLEGPLNAVENAKTAESDKEFQINRAVGQMKEPDSFIKTVRKDADGNDIYETDQTAVNQWVSALASIKSMYDELVALVRATMVAVQTAQAAVARVISTAGINREALSGAMARENKIMTGKKTSKSEKQAAKQRYGVYKDQYDAEQKNLDDAKNDKSGLVTELHDANQRLLTDQDYAAQYDADAHAVAGKAASEADAATDSAHTAAPDVPTPPTALENAQQGADALDAGDALAAIGQGTASTDAQKIAAQQAIIDAAKGQLTDADPTNDSGAYSAITSAAGVIKGIQDAATTATTTAAANSLANYTNYGSAVSSLTSQMGSNFQVAGMIGATNNAFSNFGSGAMGFNPAAAGAPSGAGVQGGIYAPIQQTFYQMPDPATWSKGIGFELQAALG